VWFTGFFCKSTCYYRKLETEGFSKIDEIIAVHNKYFNESLNLAVEHRHMHEHGTVGPPRPPPVPKSAASVSASPQIAASKLPEATTSGGAESRQSTVDARSKFEQALLGAANRGGDASVKALPSSRVSTDVSGEKQVPTTSAHLAKDKSVAVDVVRKSAANGAVQESTVKIPSRWVMSVCCTFSHLSLCLCQESEFSCAVHVTSLGNEGREFM
jgi:hypothetical protein